MDNRFKRMLTFLISEQPVALFVITIVRLSNLINNLEFLLLITFFSLLPSLSFLSFIRYPWDFKKERRLSFIVNMISFLTGLVVILILKCNKVSIFISLSYNLAGIILGVSNLLGYKASGHATSIAGPATILTAIFGLKGSLLYLLLIPAFYLKITLKDHTIGQFITGILIGMLSTVAIYYFIGGI
ncbi:MAG: hypothetical protein ACP5H0_03395 [Caldisericum sp.]|jgi:hypothetical protein|uniref:Phosphatidic acid phosphatase type 2/haloperoxidase domain-containing protein n=1 Tax=Caldisericum exile TaxID=693075 RepID=A0A2J6WEQ2_9BACT|nr:MAG: hypothetical protein C0189_02570 [Caldisericum exile]